MSLIMKNNFSKCRPV